MKKEITIYTDGASRGNPGPGGWAAIVISDSEVIELAGNPPSGGHATNNQMELMAVEEGLSYVQIHFPDANVELHADSTYVLNGIRSWILSWEKNGWITMAKKPVENSAQWKHLLTLRTHFGKKLTLVKVEGHSGHEYNDRCDELAVLAALGKHAVLFSGTPKEYQRYLQEHPPVSPEKKKSSKSKSGVAFSYVSCVDGKVFADKDWTSCEKRVKGKKGAKYKKVFSKEEETSLVQDYTLRSLI